MKTVAIITSRWQSTRLPGKALVDIGGEPMLQRIVDSIRKSSEINEVAIATTRSSQPVIDYCEKTQIGYYVGAEDDILDRLYQTAKKFQADIIVRIWGDSPLISATDIDFAIKYFRQTNPPYLTYSTIGGVIAILNLATLANAWFSITLPNEREWIHLVLSESNGAIQIGKDKPVVVDTPEDLERVRELWVMLKR